jgi:hypothetical protein
MSERTSVILGFSGVLVAAIPIIIGLYEYRINNEREFEKNFLNQQSAVYEDLLGALGGISTSISNPNDSLSQANYNQAKFQFNQLYYGKLNLYQTPFIERLTDSLYTMINNYDSLRTIDLHKPPEAAGPKANSKTLAEDALYSKQRALRQTYIVALAQLIDSIQQKVYNLSDECKRSLKSTYQLQ